MKKRRMKIRKKATRQELLGGAKESNESVTQTQCERSFEKSLLSENKVLTVLKSMF